MSDSEVDDRSIPSSGLADKKEVTYDASKLNFLGGYKQGEYENTGKVPFCELLENHHKQIIWGFRFGEAIMRQAKENMKDAMNKKIENCKRQEAELEEDNRKQDKGKRRASGCQDDKGKGKKKGIRKSSFYSEREVYTDVELTDKPGTSKTVAEMNQKTPSVKHQKKRAQKRKAYAVKVEKFRNPPLPLLNWADARDVWAFMIYKEEAALKLRNARLFEDFSTFLPRMRAILLDWLMEVCEVYHLRRVTYYLGVDYFDRFMSIRPDVPKTQVQLVGVTCLFLASKLEEVYPPRVCEFAYVCDGACGPEDILNCELLILNCLGWDLNLMTPSDWLNLYMQLHFHGDRLTPQRLHREINKDFLFPQYSGYQFTRASHLIDMMSLDPGFLRFSYSTIAASAMYYMYGKAAALRVSGLTWKQLQACAEYMAVFYHVLRDSNDYRLQSAHEMVPDEDTVRSFEAIGKRVRSIIPDENHSFQSHTINMEFFEKSTILRINRMNKEPADPSEFIKEGMNLDKMLQDIVLSNAINYPVCPSPLSDDQIDESIINIDD